MFRSPINILILINLFLLLTVLIACDFIDLRPIKYSVKPNARNSVLENSDTPLIISFDTEMIKQDAEGAILVSSDYGAVNGDFHWNGNALYFVPVSGWTAGIRYSLTINGTIRSKDGRELRIQHFVSFYAINKNAAPILEKHYPLDGESIGTNDFILELHFSASMDRLSVESAILIDGVSNKSFEWQDEDKILKIITDKPLTAWNSYSWNLKESARSVSGVPVPKQYSGSFTTNLDQTLPEVVRVYPVSFSYGSWSATGAEIETGLALGEGIAVEFNKAMGESVLRAIRFEPAITGRIEMLADNKVVYFFTRNPEPETSYTMIISGDTKDSEGLKLGSEYRLSFLPDIPYLQLLSFNNGNDATIENLMPEIVLPVFVKEGMGEAAFSLRFSLPFNSEEKQNISPRINLIPFFPKTLSPVALQFVSWEFSDDRIFMRWEGLQAGNDGEKHYYKLTIPGGKNGISSGGLYMKEDFIIYLEAQND